MRRQDDSRRQKREELKERKQREKEQKKEDLKQLKKFKLKEIQDKIAGLSVKREEFIKAEKAKDHSLKKDDFGSAVTKSIKTRAIDLGFDAAE